jgi:hypothetical protein
MSLENRAVGRWQAGFYLVVALWAALTAWYQMGQGVAIGADSPAYVSLSQGRQLNIPATPQGEFTEFKDTDTHFPPMTRWVLGLPRVLGLEPAAAALWANVALAAAFLAATCAAAGLDTGSWRGAVLAGMAVGGSGTVMAHFSHAMSEPVYLAFVGIGLLALAWRARQSGRNAYLGAATVGLIFGASLLARYAGAPITGAAILVLAVGATRWREAFSRGALGAFCAALPLVLWKLLHPADPEARAAGEHHVEFSQFREGLETISHWFFPVSFPAGPRIGLAVALVLGFWGIAAWLAWGPFLRRRRPAGPGTALLQFTSVAMPGYAFFLVLTVLYFDGQTPLDRRILTPLLYLLLLTLALLLERFLRAARGPALLRWGLLTVFTGFCLFNAAKFARDMLLAHREGREYSGLYWKNHAVILAGDDLPAGVLPVSNYSDAFAIIRRRDCATIPTAFHPISAAPNADYAAQMAVLNQWLAEGRAVLLWRESPGERHYLPTWEEFSPALDLAKLTVREMEGGYVVGRRSP